MVHRFTFPKSEKLCGKIRIKTLYDSGKHFTCYPLRVTFISGIAYSIMVGHYSTTDLAAVKVLIWAPKSLFKSAVSINRLRRQMREAYRLNSLPLKDYCGRKGITMQVAFNYIAKEQLPFAVIQKAMVKAVNKLIEA